MRTWPNKKQQVEERGLIWKLRCESEVVFRQISAEEVRFRKVSLSGSFALDFMCFIGKNVCQAFHPKSV